MRAQNLDIRGGSQTYDVWTKGLDNRFLNR